MCLLDEFFKACKRLGLDTLGDLKAFTIREGINDINGIIEYSKQY